MSRPKHDKQKSKTGSRAAEDGDAGSEHEAIAKKPAGPHRAGFIAIVGRPNVGKSTLLNRVLGQKIAIVSPKPQTTRGRILGIVTRPDAQLCLLDTPGLHEAKGGLNARMVQSALQTLADADAALFLIEAGSPAIDPGTRKALDQVKASRKPLLLVINKIDTVKKQELLPLIARWKDEHDWTEIYPLSALNGDNVDGFLDQVAKHLPEGPALFGEDVWTDVPERTLCAELVREQIMRQLSQEVPYSCAVVIEEFDETERETGKRGLVRIHASVLVERDSQKSIVIGKGGARLKEIGTLARKEMERLLGCKVFLQLHVTVEPEWTRTDKGMRKAGYEEH